jgi:hypothetical protein
MHTCLNVLYLPTCTYLSIYLHPLNKERKSALSIMSFSIHASSSFSFVLQLMNRASFFCPPS